MKGAILGGLLASAVMMGRVASAADPAECESSTRPRIEVILPARFPPSLAPFVELLRVELGSRGIDVCKGTPSNPPIATVEVEPRGDGVALSVEVRDAVTAKRVGRDVSLEGAPVDSRPLTVALAADELLRASWAELSLRDRPPPQLPVPVAVARTVEEGIRPDDERGRVDVGLLAAAEHFAAGTTLYGADARASVDLGRFATGIRLGLRSSGAVRAVDGEIATTAFLAGLSEAVRFTPPAWRWSLEAVVRLDFDHLSFVPTPRANSVGVPEAGNALVSGAGLQGGVRVTRHLRVGAELLAALALRPVYVTDARSDVTGVGGAGVTAALGAWTAF